MFEQDFCVNYDDIDFSNHMSHQAFLKYFQEIGCLHASSCGLGTNDVSKTHLVWIILDWKITILKRPVWNEKIHVRTWPSNAEHAFYYRDYEMTDASGNRVAIGTSRWVLMDITTKQIIKNAENYSSVLPVQNEHVYEEPIKKLKEPSSYESTFSYTILRRDIDTNLHTNNINYICFAIEALPKDVYQSLDCNSVEIMYKKQCFLGDSVVCHYHYENGEHIVSIKSADEKKLHAIVRFGK